MNYLSVNAISQRNLNDYQRSVLVLELEGYYKVKAKERKVESGKITGRGNKKVVPTLAPPLDTGKVRNQLAKKAGVSLKTNIGYILIQCK